jgi:hypothetical protein
MGGFDFMQFTLNGSKTVMDQYAGIFVPTALSMSHYAAAIVLAWFGIQVALNGINDELFARFVGLVILICAVFGMLNHYTTPFPLIGHSFPGIISSGTEWMTHQIGQDAAAKVESESVTLFSFMEVPSGYQVFAWLDYTIIWLCIMALNVVVFLATSIGIVMSVLAVIFGPFAIVSLIIPHFDWIWNAWIRSYFAFCMMQPIGAALSAILAAIFLPALGSLPQPLSIHDQISLTIGLVTMILALTVIAFKLPSYSSMLMSGQSGGESLADKIGGAAVRAGTAIGLFS